MTPTYALAMMVPMVLTMTPPGNVMLMTRKLRLGADKAAVQLRVCFHDETSAGGSTGAAEGWPRVSGLASGLALCRQAHWVGSGVNGAP